LKVVLFFFLNKNMLEEAYQVGDNLKLAAILLRERKRYLQT